MPGLPTPDGAQVSDAILNAWIDRHRIVETCAAVGLKWNDRMARPLHDYVRLFLKWNRTYNLSAARDESALIPEHVFDCLAIIEPLTRSCDPGDATLIDMGSGGGLPGILIAIACPCLEIVLVEPVAKKAAFLRQAIAVLRLSQVHVAEARMNQLRARLDVLCPPLSSRRLRHFSSRAFADMATLVNHALPYARPGSILYAMKSSRLDDELRALTRPPLPEHIHRIIVPGIPAPRYLVALPLATQARTASDAPSDIPSKPPVPDAPRRPLWPSP